MLAQQGIATAKVVAGMTNHGHERILIAHVSVQELAHDSMFRRQPVATHGGEKAICRLAHPGGKILHGRLGHGRFRFFREHGHFLAVHGLMGDRALG